MKTFKQYITEAERRSQDIDFDGALDLIQENCQEIIQQIRNGYQIWRGVSSSDHAMFVDPSQYERKSANTSNFYTMMIDHSSLWKDYPDRSRSIVCTTSFDKAEGHGRVYSVFPYDGSKIGVVPEEDIWIAFNRRITDVTNMNLSLNQFNKSIGEIVQTTYNWLGFHDEYSPKFDYKKVMNDWNELNKFNKQLNSLSDKEKHEILDELVLSQHEFEAFLNSNIDNFINWIDKEILDPNESNFDLKTTSNFDVDGDHEVWTDGKSIMIQHDYLNDNKEAVEKFKQVVFGE